MSSHLTVDTRKLVRTQYTSFSGGDRGCRRRVALALGAVIAVVFFAMRTTTDRTDNAEKDT